MKIATTLLIALFAATTGFSQAHGSNTKTLTKVLELKIPREGGANAASVAWHPVLKRYYAAMAGNQKHFIGAYSTTGKLLSPVTQNSMFDIRGLWYNPFKKALQMNGYNDLGWAQYVLAANGNPSSVKLTYEGMNQPDEQSVGAYNPKEDVVYFLDEDGNIAKYKNGEYIETIDIYLDLTEEEGDEDFIDNELSLEDYNQTAIVYTGIKGSEIGLYNHDKHMVVLYNIKTGYRSKTIALPDSAPAPDFLNFAYANGIYWLFDNVARIWKGYK
jgi:hypothetical protein